MVFRFYDVIRLAKQQSPAALSSETQKENTFWKYKSFKAEYLPQLDLTSDLPGFVNSNIPVVQPEGDISYQHVSYSSSNLALSLSQIIPQTGGKFSVDTDLEGFYDFKDHQTEYSYSPVSLTFKQPIFSFNPHDWNRKIERIKYEESKKQYHLEMEQLSIQATNLFFDLIAAQISKEIALLNMQNNDTIYKIANGRYDLGKIAENELLQIELQYLKSQQDLEQAQISIENTQMALRNFLGIKKDSNIRLLIPESIGKFTVDVEKAIEKAYQNRPEILQFERERLQAEKQLKKAKADAGLNADLWVKYGLTSKAGELANIIADVGQQERLNISLKIPILDWGHNKAQIKQAEANSKLINYNLEQQKIAFEEEIYTYVNSFRLQKKQVKIAERADRIALKRFDVTKNRYMIGNISITDMNLATQEKDAARRGYIMALKNYWQAYFTLRKLTLYDFESNKDLIENEK
jgi:outer membrane protein TolC